MNYEISESNKQEMVTEPAVSDRDQVISNGDEILAPNGRTRHLG